MEKKKGGGNGEKEEEEEGGREGEKEGRKEGGREEGTKEWKGEDVWKDREKESLFLHILISVLLVSSWETEKQLEQDLKGQMA